MIASPEALGLHLQIACVSEKKRSAQQYILANHSVGHLYASVEEHIAGSGRCLVHRDRCTSRAAVDIVVAGLPCQPFTSAREQNDQATSRRKRPAPDHPDFETTFTLFIEFLRLHKPGAFLVENVMAFTKRDASAGDTYHERFMRLCAAEGYSCSCMKASASEWLDWPRDRLRIRSNCMLLAFPSQCPSLLWSGVVVWRASSLLLSVFRCSRVYLVGFDAANGGEKAVGNVTKTVEDLWGEGGARVVECGSRFASKHAHQHTPQGDFPVAAD